MFWMAKFGENLFLKFPIRVEHLKQWILSVPHVCFLNELGKAQEPVPDTHLIEEMDFHEVALICQDQVDDFHYGVRPHPIIDEEAESSNFFNHVVAILIWFYVIAANAEIT